LDDMNDPHDENTWIGYREEFKALVDDFFALVMDILAPRLHKVIDKLEKGISWLRYWVDKRSVVSEAMKETIVALDDDEWEE
jgi:hypothetical protein